ncbi:hypothetical protein [uncultured Marixanthomonas sp.]|uniref:hypothetical protein n=1 Tax=uncultured Marixanthomonas sp. TaxID=757245 RepID=UPI0030DBE94B|tara:strand:+ start:6873 stop:7373 length:501 start_codon:yes stop_codon:yes gene_type:complete
MDKQKYTSGFKIPKGYFEAFEEDLFTTIASDKLPKETGFAAPKGYFDSLEETLMQHPDISGKKTKVRSLFANKNLRYVVAVAASIVLIVLLFNQNKTVAFDINSVDYLAIENYINEGELDFDVYDVSSMLSENDNSSLYYETETISEEDMESYLLETVDESILLNE